MVVCRGGGRRCCAAVRGVGRRCWGCSFWCAARSMPASRGCSSRLRSPLTKELAQNVASLGWDLKKLQADGLLAIDHVRISEGEIVETGAWDLEGLFIRLGAAIDAVGAKRVVLDTVEALFGPLGDQLTLRSELRRLFRWLNDRGVTAIVTGERGDGSLNASWARGVRV
jgi:hypothetical protein